MIPTKARKAGADSLVRPLGGVTFPASQFLFLAFQTALLLGRLVSEAPSLLGFIVLTKPPLLGGSSVGGMARSASSDMCRQYLPARAAPRP